MEGIKSVNVRFPNESMYDKVYTFNLEDFELEQVFAGNQIHFQEVC